MYCSYFSSAVEPCSTLTRLLIIDDYVYGEVSLFFKFHAPRMSFTLNFPGKMIFKDIILYV